VHEPFCLLMPGVPVGALFAEMEIPFPLYEGEVTGTEFCGLATCSLCLRSNEHCFLLGVGDYLMIPCAACGSVNGLSADARKDTQCRSCQRLIPFPVASSFKKVRICYGCLRDGRAALPKDTELGGISWEEAFEGVTRGVPGLQRTDFELVSQGDDWMGALLPQETMFELLRTPTYCTWQGEQWLFCCQRPMIYVGNWTTDDFCKAAPDGNGTRLLRQVIPEANSDWWSAMMSTYIFRCPVCQRLKGHYDCD
jgi:uncharacterized protein CbrC (UPF0167 family)